MNGIKNKKLNKSLRRVAAVLMIAILSMSTMAGCADKSFESYRPIDNLDDLEGRKVGVGIGWCPDYLLSDRDDMILYRYDTTSDMLLALCYKQLDAVAVDYTTAKQILAMSTGLRQVEGELTMDSIQCYTSADNEELCEMFNEWFEDFKNTERYTEWLDRFYAFDGNNYEWEGEELTGTGKKYTFATYSEWYPFGYINNKGEVEGFEAELMTMFANDMNLDVTFVGTEETDLYSGLTNEMYDMMFGCVSILYEEEALTVGYHVTDVIYQQPIVMLEIADPDNLGIANVEDLG